jgi:Flp pilus assembly protein TadD
MSITTELARAQDLLRRGQVSAAEAVCRELLRLAPRDAGATHLLGIVRKQAGDFATAEQYLRSSIDLAPQRPDFRHNLANLLRALGRYGDAEAAYRSALGLDASFRPARLGLIGLYNDVGQYAPAEAEARRLIASNAKDADALTALGVALRGQGRMPEAEAAYRSALATAPNNVVARHNLGALLSQLGRAEDSLVELDRAAAAGLHGRELSFNRGRALFDLYRFDEAERSFEEAVKAAPGDVESHVALAKLRHMRGEADFGRSLREAAIQRPQEIRLHTTYAEVLRRGGDRSGAERALRPLLAGSSDRPPSVLMALASVLHDSDRVPEALALAREASSKDPDNANLADGLVSILLSSGAADEAWPIIEREQGRAPLHQGWLAYRATAARLLGNDEYRWLYDYDAFVRPYDLQPPAGWSSIEAFHADLIPALEARHRFEAHPLDQSLRGGTQTARNLLTDPEPVIQSFIRALAEPIAAYRAAIGYDPAHALRSRNRGDTRLAGCWSVRLRRGGFHVNHVHPEGWISSAYYVSVPPEVADETVRSGWIKFGEPRFPVPGAGAERFVQPRPGRLVLFPSYMWHGTTPITGDAPRMTIAFDAVPEI